MGSGGERDGEGRGEGGVGNDGLGDGERGEGIRRVRVVSWGRQLRRLC